MASRRSVSRSYVAARPGRAAHGLLSVSQRRAAGFRSSIAAPPQTPPELPEQPSPPPAPRADFGLYKARNYRYSQPAPPPAQTPLPSIRDEFLSRMERRHEQQKKQQGDWKELPTDRVILHGDIGQPGQPYYLPWGNDYGALSDPEAHNRDQGGKPGGKKVKK